MKQIGRNANKVLLLLLLQYPHSTAPLCCGPEQGGKKKVPQKILCWAIAALSGRITCLYAGTAKQGKAVSRVV